MTPKQLVTRSAAAASLILLGSIAAHADDDIRELEDLTVTSDLREDTSADELATSISVLDEQILDAVAEQHFEELIEYVPNLNYSSATSRARYFQIRGIAENLGVPVKIWNLTYKSK